MTIRKTDVAVIGAGSAGLAARRAALKHNASVLLIESGPYGTTCARVGCMPSKLLIAAADAAYEMKHAERFGVSPKGGVRVDDQAVLGRVRRERDRFAGFVVRSVESIPDEQKLRGRARFTAPTVLEVSQTDGQAVQVEAKSVVIATGSSPWDPPVLGGAGDALLHNDDVFELERLPASVAVVGTGVIGLELGQALHRLGVRTSLFTIDDLIGPMTDPEVKQSVRDVLGRELDIHLRVNILEVRRRRHHENGDNGRLSMRWQDAEGQVHSGEFERLLAATGRKPNLSNLDLEHTGLQLDRRGTPRFDTRTMQCEDSPIFIAGDANNDRPLLHEASDEGHIAGQNAATYPQVNAQRRRLPLTIVFTSPQMAIVGKSLAEIKRMGADYEVGRVDYGNQGRARVMGQNEGIVKVYGRWHCGSLLGAEMFGPRVEHTAHLLAWAAQQNLCVGPLLNMPFYHPVVEEGIRTALRDLSAQLKMRCDADPLCDGAGA